MFSVGSNYLTESGFISVNQIGLLGLVFRSNSGLVFRSVMLQMWWCIIVWCMARAGLIAEDGKCIVGCMVSEGVFPDVVTLGYFQVGRVDEAGVVFSELMRIGIFRVFESIGSSIFILHYVTYTDTGNPVFLAGPVNEI